VLSVALGANTIINRMILCCLKKDTKTINTDLNSPDSIKAFLHGRKRIL
jgi:hypothetical protein